MAPGRVWNHPDEVAARLWRWLWVPRSYRLGNWRYGLPTRSYFVSGHPVCRLLKAHDLITSPSFVVIKGPAG